MRQMDRWDFYLGVSVQLGSSWQLACQLDVQRAWSVCVVRVHANGKIGAPFHDLELMLQGQSQNDGDELRIHARLQADGPDFVEVPEGGSHQPPYSDREG